VVLSGVAGDGWARALLGAASGERRDDDDSADNRPFVHHRTHSFAYYVF
jgi:hypothetical protein